MLKMDVAKVVGETAETAENAETAAEGSAENALAGSAVRRGTCNVVVLKTTGAPMAVVVVAENAETVANALAGSAVRRGICNVVVHKTMGAPMAENVETVAAGIATKRTSMRVLAGSMKRKKARKLRKRGGMRWQSG